jgi:hypothetical protein
MIGAAVVVIFNLLIIAALAYYVYRALKQRAALAPGWSFDRDQQPFLFWLQVCAVGLFALWTAAKLMVGLVKLTQLF